MLAVDFIRAAREIEHLKQVGAITEDERIRLRNELRAEAGLPPIPARPFRLLDLSGSTGER